MSPVSLFLTVWLSCWAVTVLTLSRAFRFMARELSRDDDVEESRHLAQRVTLTLSAWEGNERARVRLMMIYLVIWPVIPFQLAIVVLAHALFAMERRARDHTEGSDQP